MVSSEIVDKKVLVKYKNTLKKIMTTITKFGSDKKEKNLVNIYNYISSTGDIHPVVFVIHEINPWGEEFHPTRMFFTGVDFPEDINIFKTKSNIGYRITSSSSIDVDEFKKETIDSLKEMRIITTNDGCKLDYKVLSRTNNIDNYVDVFATKSKSIENLTLVPKSKFNVISDANELRNIHSMMVDNTQFTINHNGKPLQMFYSVFPIKMDKLEYARLLEVYDNDVTSSVYSKQFVSNIIIHNFYKYIDVWNLLGKGK